MENDRVCLAMGQSLNNSRLLEEECHDESSAPKPSALPTKTTSLLLCHTILLRICERCILLLIGKILEEWKPISALYIFYINCILINNDISTINISSSSSN